MVTVIGVVLVATLVVAVASTLARRTGLVTTLSAESEGVITTYDGRVGNVYDYGIWVEVHGRGSVRIVSSHTNHADGLTELSPLVGTRCTHHGGIIYGGVGSGFWNDPHDPHDIRLPQDTKLRSSHDDPCWYVVLRFLPTRLGTFDVSQGEIVYRTGGQTHTAHFDYALKIEVTGTGKDPRDKS